MNKLKHFVFKYLLSSIAVIFLFFILNTALVYIASRILLLKTSDSITPVLNLTDEFTEDKKGSIHATQKAISTISDKASWAMILDDNGSVIWDYKLPDSFSKHYTASEVAQFSRWYLNDYPVIVESIRPGLLVVGYPVSHITKLNFSLDTELVQVVKRFGILILLVNIIIVVALSYLNMYKLQNEILPIIDGIETISHGKPVTLPEKGELAQVYQKLNRAGKYISQKETARTEWINGISHDIRTPLSLILGYASELEEDMSLPEHVRKQCHIIQNQGQTLRSLVSDLNLCSKLEHGIQPLKSTSILPLELVRQVISNFLNNDLDESYTLDMDIADDASTLLINGDESLLKRMLTNLIQNCITHNPHGCHITVHLNKIAERCEFIIEDDGVGIPDTQREQLNAGKFTLYSHDGNEEAPHGVGLHLVYQIVQAHGGKIVFEQNESRGLMVRIILR